MPSLASSSSPGSDWTTNTSPKTQSVTASAGNVIVVLGGTEDAAVTLGAPSDGANAYSPVTSSALAGFCGGYAWAAGQVGQLAVTTASLPNAVNGTAYSVTETAAGGSGSGYTWAVTGGSLPSWASLNASTGVISGTPNATGTASFTITVTDSAANKASQAQSITTASTSIQPLGPGGAWTLVFEDQFTGTSLNPANWTAVQGANNSGVTTQASSVSVSGGNCVLVLAGMICSNPVSGFPGPSTGPALAVGDCVEARVSFPGPAGDTAYNWPAFWASGASWPANGEEDIFESYNGTPSALNYHNSSGANNGPFPAGSWCNSFHVYTLVRGSSTYDCYWDGALVRSVAKNDSGGAQSILFLIGSANTSSSSAQTLVDYVRVWTPG